jgi:(2Fe-2S) ferredoxin/2-polyprenyl-3-methyl-5-hydroxy-6-metoxy-1,4-benzoquinol methylase
MQPFTYHVFVCDQRKPEGLPCCSARGSIPVIEALRREIAMKGLLDVVQVTTCGSLGLCERGPNMIVYPDGIWYSGVTPQDIPEIVAEHFMNGRPVNRLMNHDGKAVKQEITENRNRMMAVLKARDAAGVLPDDIMDMVRGYQQSRILLTAIELDVFTAVERCKKPATAVSVANDLKTHPRSTEKLLNAIVALGFLQKQEGAFSTTLISKRFFVDGAPDDSRTALRHNLSLWATWSSLTQCVREGNAVHVKRMEERGDSWTEPFIAAMHRNAAFRAPIVVNAVGTDGVNRMLDVGGGSGAYSIAFARTNPTLHADVFDLSTVTPIAAKHIAEAGMNDSIRTIVGDLRTDRFGSGYDLTLVSAICHMLSPEENIDLLHRVFEALVPGGRIVIQDQVMSTDKTSPRMGALFAINMLVGTTGGSTYSQEEYTDWLQKAGFIDIRRISLMGPGDLMIGKRP